MTIVIVLKNKVHKKKSYSNVYIHIYYIYRMGDISEDNEIGYIEGINIQSDEQYKNFFISPIENIGDIRLENFKYILKKEDSKYYLFKEEKFNDFVKKIKDTTHKIVYKIDKIYENIQQDKQGNQNCIIPGACSVDCSEPPEAYNSENKMKIYLIDDGKLVTNERLQGILGQEIENHQSQIDILQNYINITKLGVDISTIEEEQLKNLTTKIQNIRENSDKDTTSLQNMVKMYDTAKTDIDLHTISSSFEDTIKNKEKVVHKIDDDIQMMNRSIQESKEKDILQHKIKTVLSIVIILFAILCFGGIIYHFVGDTIKKNIQSKVPGFIKGNMSSNTKKTMAEALA